MFDIPRILEPKENVVWEGKPKFMPYFISSIFGIIIFMLVVGFLVMTVTGEAAYGLIAVVVIFFLSLIFIVLYYNRTHYAITNKRAILQSGLIGRDFKSVDYDRMQNVSVDVGLLGVIFGAGSVKIFTGEMTSSGGARYGRYGSGGGGIRPKYDTFRYVDNPYEVMKTLQTHLSARKERTVQVEIKKNRDK